MKHEGFSKDRLKPERENQREVAFSEAWKRENGYGRNGNHLVDQLIPDATQRDATVAATIIQWLGSNVGIGFLRDVIHDNPLIARQLGVKEDKP